MKILIDHQLPFCLAHGGLQIQIERTKDALESLGLEVEYLRWWDESQKGDIIHFFGRAHPLHIEFAHAKGMKYVMTELLSGQSSRPHNALLAQSLVHRVLERVTPPILLDNLRWSAHKKSDAVIVLTKREADVAEMLFQTPRTKLFIVPNGVDDEFFAQSKTFSGRSDELLCVATIRSLKRNVELAQAALEANIPIRFVGTPYSHTDPYFVEFLRVQQRSPTMIRYEGPISDRGKLAELYRRARGFVLLSSMESLSLSALEAAASGCPLLLSDLPWARCTFGATATYCPIGPIRSTAKFLQSFYENASKCPVPAQPLKWRSIADRLIGIYRVLH